MADAEGGEVAGRVADREADGDVARRLAAAEAQIARLREDCAAGRAREERLSAELHRRMRNMLAIIRSIFARTVDTSASADHLADHFRGRLDTLARYQLQAGTTVDGRFDLEDIVRDELILFGVTHAERIDIDGPAVRLDYRMAEMIGLALHELATNSVKFGALGDVGGGGGKLRVAWTATPDRLDFEWVESGVPIMSGQPPTAGFGREYIEQALPYQMNATTEFSVAPGGLRCRIALPIASGDEMNPKAR